MGYKEHKKLGTDKLFVSKLTLDYRTHRFERVGTLRMVQMRNKRTGRTTEMN